jgi:hypothetical protein
MHRMYRITDATMYYVFRDRFMAQQVNEAHPEAYQIYCSNIQLEIVAWTELHSFCPVAFTPFSDLVIALVNPGPKTPQYMLHLMKDILRNHIGILHLLLELYMDQCPPMTNIDAQVQKHAFVLTDVHANDCAQDPLRAINHAVHIYTAGSSKDNKRNLLPAPVPTCTMNAVSTNPWDTMQHSRVDRIERIIAMGSRWRAFNDRRGVDTPIKELSRVSSVIDLFSLYELIPPYVPNAHEDTWAAYSKVLCTNFECNFHEILTLFTLLLFHINLLSDDPNVNDNLILRNNSTLRHTYVQILESYGAALLREHCRDYAQH